MTSIQEIKPALKPAMGGFGLTGKKPIDRRARKRFCLDLRGRYRSVDSRIALSGFGSILNISSVGVLMTHQETVRIGTLMELSIEWPVLSAENVPLELVVVGKVVRSENQVFAIILERSPRTRLSAYRFAKAEHPGKALGDFR
jgi:hypothetical protein